MHTRGHVPSMLPQTVRASYLVFLVHPMCTTFRDVTGAQEADLIASKFVRND
jgi:hypothetical protein